MVFGKKILLYTEIYVIMKSLYLICVYVLYFIHVAATCLLNFCIDHSKYTKFYKNKDNKELT